MNSLRWVDWLMLVLTLAAVVRYWLAEGFWRGEATVNREAAEAYRQERDFWRAEAGRLRDLVDSDIAERAWEENLE